MNKICRICMTESTEIMLVLYEECEILSKIWTCMSVHITLNSTLPNQICQICVNKINEIHELYTKILQNEQKLIHHITFGKDSVQYLYEDIKSVTKIKDEKEQMTDDHENCCDNNVLSQDINYSSDDEIKLSDVKQEKKDLNHIKMLKKTKQKTNLKYKNIKGSIRQTRQESENIELNCLTCFKHCESQSALIKHYYNNHKMSENLVKDNNKQNNYNDNIQIDNGTPTVNKDSKKATDDSSKANNADLITVIKSVIAINDNSKVDYKYEKYTKSLDNGKIIYKCLVCMKQYEKKKDIDRHIISHGSDRPFLCKLCGRTYKTVYEIIRHGRAHSAIKLHCSHKCGFTTSYKGALKEHELRHGVLEYKYTCEKCGKGFQAKTWYEQHQNIHSGLKPFICNICGLAFHMDRYLTAHRSAVHPQTSKVKRYVCIHCSLPCDSRNSLKRHMEEHGVKSTYLCDLCGKVFTNADVLKYHKNRHMGVKPYTCSVCKKSFAKKFNLKVHELTHTGVRSHVCVMCGKYFTQRSTLLRHNRRHHPENPKDNASVDENTRKTSN